MVKHDNDIEFSIVSGSNEEMLFECIKSLYATMSDSPYSWSLTVTCNATSPTLAARVHSAYPSAKIIDNPSSRGFAANHNTVLFASRARYVWLLNDDLLILPDTIRKVTEYMDRPENARVGVVSPRLLNPDGSLQPSTYGFPTMPQLLLVYSGLREHRITHAILSRVAPVLRPREGSSRFWAHDRTIDVDTFRGACVAMRMGAVHDVGPMTEVAIVGAEETEWHRRFHQKGWKVVYFADASVIHYGSQTVREGGANMYPEYLKGALYYFKTGSTRAAYTAFCTALIGVFGVRTAIAAARRDKSKVTAARRYAAVAWNGLRGR
jgi:GT2 family glycosyltransferase